MLQQYLKLLTNLLMSECSGKAAPPSCLVTENPQVVPSSRSTAIFIFLPGKLAPASETKCHSTFPKQKTQDTKRASRNQLLALIWMAKCFYLWHISEQCPVELSPALSQTSRTHTRTDCAPSSGHLVITTRHQTVSPDQAYFLHKRSCHKRDIRIKRSA